MVNHRDDAAELLVIFDITSDLYHPHSGGTVAFRAELKMRL